MFLFLERLSQPSLPFCPDYIRPVTVLSIGNIAKAPETVSLKRMKISGVCCSSGIFRNKVCLQFTESSFPCPGGAVLPGAGLLKFGHMLCWQCELPQTRLAPRQLPLGGSQPSQSKPDGFASSPEGGSFVGANRQMQKAPPERKDFPRSGEDVARRQKGESGERSETERVFSLYFAFLHIFTTFLW